MFSFCAMFFFPLSFCGLRYNMYMVHHGSTINMGCNVLEEKYSWELLNVVYIHYTYYIIHWNGNVIILTTFLSLAALEFVILANFDAANDQGFVWITVFPSNIKRKQLHNFEEASIDNDSILLSLKM